MQGRLQNQLCGEKFEVPAVPSFSGENSSTDSTTSGNGNPDSEKEVFMDFHRLMRGAAAADRMRHRGMTPNGHLLWDPFEAGNLRYGYPDYPSVMALNVLRTRPAHYGKAGRMGITRSRTWSDNDLIKLHRCFPRATRKELEDMFPERTWSAICSRAWKDGYRRPAKGQKPTGNHLLDQIYWRAQDMGWKLRELDAECAAKGYFARRAWRTKGWNFAIHFRAVRLLGGELAVRWRVQQ